MDRTLVSSMPNTTAPLANRAIFPVSNVIRRDPISNSSLNVSRTLVLETGVSESAGEVEIDGARMRRPVVMVRRKCKVLRRSREERRWFLRIIAIEAMATVNLREVW